MSERMKILTERTNGGFTGVSQNSLTQLLTFIEKL